MPEEQWCIPGEEDIDTVIGQSVKQLGVRVVDRDKKKRQSPEQSEVGIVGCDEEEQEYHLAITVVYPLVGIDTATTSTGGSVVVMLLGRGPSTGTRTLGSGATRASLGCLAIRGGAGRVIDGLGASVCFGKGVLHGSSIERPARRRSRSHRGPRREVVMGDEGRINGSETTWSLLAWKSDGVSMCGRGRIGCF